MAARSLLNGQEKYITYQMNMQSGQTFQGVGLIWSILRRHVPENIHTKIKGMRALASMDGGVFDVEEEQA